MSSQKDTTSQKDTKDFETEILKLALITEGRVISGEEGLEIIKSNEAFRNIKSKNVSSVVSAVIHLNSKFEKVWTDGYNANFKYIPEPLYGTKRAKADIVLKSGEESFGFSIKMDKDFVIASAQNKDEFNGIFFSAMKEYEKDHSSVDLSVLYPYIEKLSNVVGRVVVRHMKSDHFDKKKDGIHNVWIDRLSKEIIKNNKIIEDENTIIREDTKKYNALLESKIKEFPNLMEYIIHEAATSFLKYDGKLPSAKYILCPTGCFDISSRLSKYVKACSKVAAIGIRGQCHGRMRTSATHALKSYWNTETDMNYVYNTINKMDMSLKWDVKKNNLDPFLYEV